MNMSQPFIKRRGTTSEILNNDQEREILYQKIVELLIAAGYFRARIHTLEPFDKLLGGLAWTLTGCFCDVDIEFNTDASSKSDRKQDGCRES